MKKGNQGGKKPKDKAAGKELVKMMGRQEMIRQRLEQMAKSLEEAENANTEGLRDAMRKMEKVEEDLANDNITQQTLDPDMEKWAQKNPWFMGSEPIHKEMTSFSLYIDQKLNKEGIKPATDTEKYYSEVDKAMRKEFPSFFGVQADSDSEMVAVEETPKRQPQTVVASASRDSGNKKPTQIRLTKTQVSLARQLGITPEQYANQLLKES